MNTESAILGWAANQAPVCFVLAVVVWGFWKHFQKTERKFDKQAEDCEQRSLAILAKFDEYRDKRENSDREDRQRMLHVMEQNAEAMALFASMESDESTRRHIRGAK